MDLYLVNNKIPSAVWKTNDINHIYEYIEQFRMQIHPSELTSFVRHCCRNKSSVAEDKLRHFMETSPSTNNENYLRMAIEEKADNCARIITSYGYTRVCRVASILKARFSAQCTLITELCIQDETNMLFKMVCDSKNLLNVSRFLDSHEVNIQYCHYVNLIDTCLSKDMINLFFGKFTVDTMIQACVFENLVNHNELDIAIWFINTHAPNVVIGDVLLNLYFNDGESYEHIIDSITEPQKTNIDDCMMFFVQNDVWNEVMLLHTFGYRFAAKHDEVMLAICDYTINPDSDGTIVLEWFIDIYTTWFDTHDDIKKRMFFFLCGHMSLNVIKLLCNKWKPFDGHEDPLYIECIENSGERNIEVAQWLAELFGEYFIDETTYPDCILYELKRIPLMGKIYRQIAQNPSQGRRLLEIIGGTPHKDPCVVCYDEPDDMAQLNCGHYVCMFCISNWYAKNEEKCPYCRTITQWRECKAIRTRKQILEDNDALMAQDTVTDQQVDKLLEGVWKN